jgi:hypothetical protein
VYGIRIADLVNIRESLERKQIVVVCGCSLDYLAVVPGFAFICITGIIGRVDKAPFASDIDGSPCVIGCLVLGRLDAIISS